MYCIKHLLMHLLSAGAICGVGIKRSSVIMLTLPFYIHKNKMKWLVAFLQNLFTGATTAPSGADGKQSTHSRELCFLSLVTFTASVAALPFTVDVPALFTVRNT